MPFSFRALVLFLAFFYTTCQPLAPPALFEDYEAGLAHAQAHNQPILLAFVAYGGHGYTYRYLQDYTLAYLWDQKTAILLYVDDRKVGQKHMAMQRRMSPTELYQPMYFILNAQGDVQHGPFGYKPRDSFKTYLEKHF